MSQLILDSCFGAMKMYLFDFSFSVILFRLYFSLIISFVYLFMHRGKLSLSDSSEVEVELRAS